MPSNFTYRGARYSSATTNPISPPVSAVPQQLMGTGLLLNQATSRAGVSATDDNPTYKPVIQKGGSLGSSIGKKLENLKMEAKRRKPQNIKFSI